ncbi:hypothetical protein HHK36_030582 [Tetracentron sinense]|uniref:F-actin-capping protein subunit beta n=1 Tax=Tetracentron sinense TaxID=13715 RepID=A0A834Y9U7_TETSI|nr:hypothetical protein HHK36_030582 [Tetracentron sinense]
MVSSSSTKPKPPPCPLGTGKMRFQGFVFFGVLKIGEFVVAVVLRLMITFWVWIVLRQVEANETYQVLCDMECGKEFILYSHNHIGQTNTIHDPPLEDGWHPSTELRKLEIEANDVFTIYRDRDGLKSGHGQRGYLQEGAWDAVHVIEVGAEEEQTAHYCLTNTVMLSLTTSDESSGTFNLSGSIRRHMNMDLSVALGHLRNMGRMIEEMESKLRNSLDQVLIQIEDFLKGNHDMAVARFS